jgi:hypothetical protein
MMNELSVLHLAVTLTEPPSWVVLSIFSLVGLFVVFHRFWSLRNLDILLVLSFIPGFMLVYEGQQGSGIWLPGTAPETKLYWGFLSLLVCCGLMTVRMLWDTAIVRRPLLEPNLNSGGMLFIGISLILFLVINIAMSQPSPGDSNRASGLGPGNVLLRSIPRIETMQAPQASDVDHSKSTSTAPGADVADASSNEKSLPAPNNATLPAVAAKEVRRNLWIPKILAIASNLILIASIVGIGYWHFGSFNTGVGTATLYLLLPYTAHTAGNVAHVVPGALLLLALLMYRQPLLAGIFLGCAAGVVYYPFYLLPLWCSFYWQRGIQRFALGFAISIVSLVIAMALLYQNNFLQHLGYMFGIKQVEMQDLYGVWGLGWHPIARIPIIVVYIILSMSFVVWPAQKNLATLMSCSAGLLAAAQFWHGFGGGLFLAWFLPFAILTIFRPNLDYCVALEVVRPIRRKSPTAAKQPPNDPPMAAA